MILCLVVQVSLFSCTKAEHADLAITHVTIIDAAGAPAQPNMTVLITGNRITKIIPAQRQKVAGDVQVIDGAGRFLIPGLWDMHVHIARNEMYSRDRDIFMSLFLVNGITGVRDCVGDLAVLKRWREDVERGKLTGPRIVAAGPALDGPDSGRLNGLPVADATHGRQLVHKVIEDGADFIKVIEGLPRETYFAIAEEANRLNTPFVGHIPPSVKTIEASDSGMKSIEHLWGVLLACSSDEENLIWSDKIKIVETYDDHKAALLIQRFVQNETWHCPTLVLDHYKRLMDSGARYSHEVDPTLDPNLKYMSSYWTEDYWPATLKRMVRAVYMYDNRTEEGAAANDRFFRKESEITGKMFRAGVNFLAGTDCIAAPYVLPGFSLHHELSILVDAGLTPLDALQTATLNPAKFFGRLDELGTVEEGKTADLVLLDADPLVDIRNTQRIEAVIANGKLFEKADLEKMLKDVEMMAQTNQFEPILSRPEDDLTTKLDRYILTAVESGFSGAVLVAKGGEMILHKGYGVADREKSIPVKKDTVFDIGSITKRFTRAAVLKLEEQGKLKRSDPLTAFFDDVPADKAGITVEYLLEHTAGLHEYHDTRGDFEEMDREQAVKTILNQRLRFVPGEREAYSNSGYTLLAVIIELVSGQSYQAYLKQQLFEPAGMSRTGFYRDSLWEEGEVAVGYEGRTIGKKNSPYYWPHMTWALVGGGGMVSSVRDLFLWIQALEADKVLSEKARAEMYDPQGSPMAYAGANDFGFSAVVYEYPVEKNAIIVATNAHDSMSAPFLGKQISAILKGEEPQEIKPEELKERSSVFSKAKGWGLPDSPTGRRSEAILDALIQLDLDYVRRFIDENFTPAFVGQFSMEEHLAVFSQIHKKMGGIELLGAKKTGEFEAELLIRSQASGRQLRIFFELEAEEPHRISGISFKEEKNRIAEGLSDTAI